MEDLRISRFKDYALLDSGRFEKLERFGAYVLRRPEPQAVWDRAMTEEEWNTLPSACFKREKEGWDAGGAERGKWILKPGMPEQWWVTYPCRPASLKFRLGLTAFKHVGLFPEQSANWDFIFDQVQRLGSSGETPRVLNLFAYTGGASLAARAAGADVTHVDAVRQVITWSRENMEASGLSDIRWIVEDAVKFVRREVTRGRRYQGIILDPPAYGRGPAGEKWVLEAGILQMMQSCQTLLDPTHGFCVLNLYSMGYAPVIAANLLQPLCPEIAYGHLMAEDTHHRCLPLGVYARGAY